MEEDGDGRPVRCGGGSDVSAGGGAGSNVVGINTSRKTLLNRIKT